MDSTTEGRQHPMLDTQHEVQTIWEGDDKFKVEVSNLSLVRGKGGSVCLRFSLTWYFRDACHGILGDCSVGCLAFRDRDGEVCWGHHKLSFGGPFSKSVHSPTPGYYQLVLGIIKGSKFEKELKASDPWGRETRRKARGEAREAGDLGTVEKWQDVVLSKEGDQNGPQEEAA